MNKEVKQSFEPAPGLEQLLSGNSAAQRRRRWRNVLVLAALVVIGMLVYIRWGAEESTGQVRYLTEPAQTGTLVVRVSATGKLRPTNQVDVGSELSGIVEEVFVDDNDRVMRDQVLARLDLSRLEDNVVRSEANLAAAEAQVLQAEASVEEAAANLSRLQRLVDISSAVAPAVSEIDTASANLKRAEANLASARAGVTQARADMQSDRTSLEKATIRSPIDGIVLTRSVEPGQTVAASFQAPVLFTLAEDLSKMELLVEIDEADVGKVQIGQSASFTVDAWPGRSYAASITRLGFGATASEEDVVTFPATLQVENPDLSLRPGMTATADITTLIRENVLLIPNAALRYIPPVAGEQPEQPRSLLARLFSGPPGRNREQQVTITTSGGQQPVWVLRDGTPVQIEVTTGASNGSVTEITGGGLQAGMLLITDTLGE